MKTAMQRPSKLITGVLVAATLGFAGILSAQNKLEQAQDKKEQAQDKQEQAQDKQGVGEFAITLNSENEWVERGDGMTRKEFIANATTALAARM